MRRASRIFTLPASNLISHSSAGAVHKHSFTTLTLQQNRQNSQQQSFPGGFLKWGSLGFFRASSFAAGFNPLKAKPLDSIIDVERMKDRSAEDIASAWDDVSLSVPLLFCASNYTFYCTALVYLWFFELGFDFFFLI